MRLRLRATWLPRCLFLIVLLALPTATHAQFSYAVVNDAVTITGYAGADGEVVIPASIEGFPVKQVADVAFSNRTGLSAITIPDSVIVIGSGAFFGCSGLVRVSLGKNIATIGNGAFGDCSGLTSLTIPERVTLINGYTFKGCTGLTNVAFPDNVTTIWDYAFDGCTGLTSAAFGSGFTSLGAHVFNNCTSLARLTVAAGNSSFSSDEGVLFDKSQTGLVQYPQGKSGTAYTIPAGVTTIGPFAFGGSTLTRVNLDSGMVLIESYAFYGCSNLTGMDFPDGLVVLGDRAFSGCTGLTALMIPDSVTSIGGAAFEGCTRLTTATLSTNLGFLGPAAFYGCTELTNVTLGDQLRFLDNYTFLGCAKLAQVSIPDGVTTIGASAFYGCSGLTSLAIPRGVVAVAEDAFINCTGLTNVTVSSNVTFLNGAAFDGCSRLGNISVDAASSTFASVEGVLFDKSRTVLLKYPRAKAGDRYTIPDDVVRIGVRAFQDCTGLTDVAIPNGVTDIGYDAFRGCASLTQFAVGEANSKYGSLDGVLFDKTLELLIQYPSAKPGTAYTIPGGVTAVSDGAFYGATMLTKVMVADSLRHIGPEAFEGCPALTQVYFLGNAPSLEGATFDGSPVTVYYLPGTAGWSETLAGRPTMLWTQMFQMNDAKLGLLGEHFGFSLAGPAGVSVIVETSDDLGFQDWRPLSTNTFGVDGLAQFSGPTLKDRPSRFYRFRTQ